MKKLVIGRIGSDNQLVRRNIPTDLRLELLKSVNYTCGHCGVKFPENYLAIDHIYPFSKGGQEKLSNYQVLCKSCNCSKHDRLPQEFYKPFQLEFLDWLGIKNC